MEAQLSWGSALLLAAIQGATEFIPVSSSAHLVLVSRLLGWPGCPLSFAVAVHLGTLAAVVWYYRRAVADFLLALTQPQAQVRGPAGEKAQARRLFWLLIVASVPAGVAGFLWGDIVEKLFAAPLPVGILLLVTAGLLAWADRSQGQKGPDELSWRKAFGIGLGQAIAIMPGISRSGATIWAGRMCQLSAGWAPQFSFLLSIPAIAGAGLWKAKDWAQSPQAGEMLHLYGIAAIVAAFVGYVSIHLVVASVQQGRLFKRFGIYCLVLGLLAIIASVFGLFPEAKEMYR